MTDYNPVFMPGDAIPMTASGTIAAGDPVAVSGSGTVAKAATAGLRNVVGIAAMPALTGDRVTVFGRGQVHESVADGTVTAGDEIQSTATAARSVKTLPATSTTFAGTYLNTDAQTQVNNAVNAARGSLGIALITATDGNKVRWMMI